jgi:hypothetical protein
MALTLKRLKKLESLRAYAVFFEDVGLNERLKKWHEQEKLRLSDKEENWEKDYLSWKA